MYFWNELKAQSFGFPIGIEQSQHIENGKLMLGSKCVNFVYIPNQPYLRIPFGDSYVQRVIATDLVVSSGPVPFVGLEQILITFGYDEVDDCRCATSYSGFGALIEVIHRFCSHQLQLEVGMGVYASGHDKPTPGIDGASASGNYEISTQLPRQI